MIFLLLHFAPYRKLIRSGTFKEAPRNKVPLIIFGDGMHGKDDVHFKGHRRGITDKLYRQFKKREQLGELVDIHEFRTSVVSVLYENLNQE